MSGLACPCGSGGMFAECCEPLLKGERQAGTAEELMRSRYVAFVRGTRDYLLATWHANTRPLPEKMGGLGLGWRHLAIVETSAGGAADEQGTVVFIATYDDGRRIRQLRETSRFVREGGLWYYVDGDCDIVELGRNDPCYCGSGRKFKRCCGAPAA